MLKETLIILFVIVADGIVVYMNWYDENIVFGNFEVDASVGQWPL